MLEVPVVAGDLVLAYSDGVVEARSPAGEFFGEDRLRSVLRGCPQDPEGVVAGVLEAVDRFVGDQTPYDDLTLLAVARAGRS
jgi:sigma-B regulation protein RsbU (phosphoserine phosphatase)